MRRFQRKPLAAIELSTQVMTRVASFNEPAELPFVPFLEKRVNMDSHCARTDQCAYVFPRGRISHGYFGDKIFIIHRGSEYDRGGRMALDLENENTHSR